MSNQPTASLLYIRNYKHWKPERNRIIILKAKPLPTFQAFFLDCKVTNPAGPFRYDLSALYIYNFSLAKHYHRLKVKPIRKMPSNSSESSLLLHRINSHHTPGTNSSAIIPTTCKQSQQAPPTTTAIILGWTPLTCASQVPDSVAIYHSHPVGPNQCSSAVIQEISAPISTVWSVVRRFDNPQAYKHFLKSCHVILGDGNVGTLRQVHVISGLPAANSTERLEILDEERHVISFSVVGGDHRLSNYRSVTTLHQAAGGNGTVVVESYLVDIPVGNTKEETCVFVDTIVRCNLQSLAKIAEDLARQNGS